MFYKIKLFILFSVVVFLLSTPFLYGKADEVIEQSIEAQANGFPPLDSPKIWRTPILWDYWGFEDFIQREFPVGSSFSEMEHWLKPEGFNMRRESSLSIFNFSSLAEEQDLRTWLYALSEPYSFARSNSWFETVCGRSTYRLMTVISTDNKILRHEFDIQRCQFDFIP